jgi:hypothetical protein
MVDEPYMIRCQNSLVPWSSWVSERYQLWGGTSRVLNEDPRRSQRKEEDSSGDHKG